MSFFVEHILKKKPPMYSSLFRFGRFKLKYITRTARYWYKSGIFQATNETNLFCWVTKGFPWSVCNSQLVACVQTHLPSGKIGEGACTRVTRWSKAWGFWVEIDDATVLMMQKDIRCFQSPENSLLLSSLEYSRMNKKRNETFLSQRPNDEKVIL